MKILKWLKSTIKSTRRKLGAPWRDSWKTCISSYYAHSFRKQLEKIANSLSYNEGRAGVYTRFNRIKMRAELYTREDGEVAQVYFYGENISKLYSVVVSELEEESKKIFAELLPITVVFKKPS